MSTSCKEFAISQTVRNISQFLNGEQYFTDVEERFNIPWRIRIWRHNGYLVLYLQCDKEQCETRKLTVETEFTLKLVSPYGTSLARNQVHTFVELKGRGWHKFISWEELESDYVIDDSTIIEAHVKIIKVTNITCIAPKNLKTFMLNRSVRNVSNIREGSRYHTNTEVRFGIPWCLVIQRKDGFFKLFLRCYKQASRINNWSIRVEYTLKLMSVDGQSLLFNTQYTFKAGYDSGWDKIIRWNDMEERFMVNDSIIIEVRAKIVEMTGCEDDVDDLNEEFSFIM
ncbi:MATH domain-containing protein [Caenorhabditis elegans]|uniref:MATH domain-containing protein n=1 Tax=Caenorhabditis elegans TaxID=6239 RepID=U4PC47_CAEEL|nr:MATH domain-containing protein [Caenorhabditis elegans]CDH93438.1 MATH domain-containing protein [Caenorhabditis elegans]|eukprot:NP_001293583.1 Uncharacterized protein CELE_ZK250.14 [Caenorhabditis elegans]